MNKFSLYFVSDFSNSAELHQFIFKKDSSSDDLTYGSTYLSVYV